ncbi:MAG: pimelyl-[acyl-carrier protein] methyl ester esterase [Gammaproteobacteria bacterium]|nr:pimelyl-[acyl-carrier protein] methyl ester esterase [Gammaproteobacteria bacterium]
MARGISSSRVILCCTFAGNPRPRLAFIRPLLPFLPFHGTGSSLRLSRFLVLGRWITPPIRLPTLCLVARHDRLIPKAAARLIRQQAPAATLVEIDAPHCLLQCEAGQAAAKIREFLHELS